MKMKMDMSTVKTDMEIDIKIYVNICRRIRRITMIK